MHILGVSIVFIKLYTENEYIILSFQVSKKPYKGVSVALERSKLTMKVQQHANFNIVNGQCVGKKKKGQHLSILIEGCQPHP